MKILGIDPGYATLGYGVIEFANMRFTSLCHGAIITSPKDNFSKRLQIIFDDLYKIISTYSPDASAVEKLYFQNNHKTAIDVAQARGVILLALEKFNIPIYEYTPLQVKTAVTGYGKALKPQVMTMTKRLLRLKDMPKPDDTADALAIAICHANSSGYRYINKKINL